MHKLGENIENCSSDFNFACFRKLLTSSKVHLKCHSVGKSRTHLKSPVKQKHLSKRMLDKQPNILKNQHQGVLSRDWLVSHTYPGFSYPSHHSIQAFGIVTSLHAKLQIVMTMGRGSVRNTAVTCVCRKRQQTRQRIVCDYDYCC